MSANTVQGCEYPDIPKAEFLYAPCMGANREKDGVITVDDFVFLEYPSKSGSGLHCVTFGGNALVAHGFASQFIERLWISVASMVVMFRPAAWPDIKGAIIRETGERSFWKVRCSRLSASKAMRGYMRRRDSYLKGQQ